MLDRWSALLDRLNLTDGAGLGPRLLERWAEPHRRYHTPAHLGVVLDRVDALSDHAPDPDLVRMAAWYHDAVYRGKDDEEASARLAEAELPGLGLDGAGVAEVARLVRLTAGHRCAEDDGNGAVLCDADLSVLAALPTSYAEYARAVRAEYAYVPDDAFRAGRASVLRALLALPRLYRIATWWEAPARSNIERELAGLGVR